MFLQCLGVASEFGQIEHFGLIEKDFIGLLKLFEE